MCFQIWLKFLTKKVQKRFKKIQENTLVEYCIVHEFFSGFFGWLNVFNFLNYWETLSVVWFETKPLRNNQEWILGPTCFLLLYAKSHAPLTYCTVLEKRSTRVLWMVNSPGFVLIIFFDRKTFYLVFLMVPPRQDKQNNPY